MSLHTNKHSGSVIGGSLLVSGSCIGAGMMGLPIKAGLGGLMPFILYFSCAWLYMLLTGLILLEANARIGQRVSLVTLAKKTLGKWGQGVYWIIFCFIFYSLMVAYVASSSRLLSVFLQEWLSVDLNPSFSAVCVTLLFGGVIIFGTKTVDWMNRVFMLGVVVTYVFLLSFGINKVDVQLLNYTDWSMEPLALPVMITMFGFHNLIPSLFDYMGGEIYRVKRCIVYGSIFAFIVCFFWVLLVIGRVPVFGHFSLTEALHTGKIVTELISYHTNQKAWIFMGECFAFCAIITSFLGVALSFIDFLSDGLRLKKSGISLLVLGALVLFPAYIFSQLSPTIFLTALSVVGLCALIIFGIMPVIMTWKLRNSQSHQDTLVLVKGGKPMLVTILLLSLLVLCLEFV